MEFLVFPQAGDNLLSCISRTSGGEKCPSKCGDFTCGCYGSKCDCNHPGYVVVPCGAVTCGTECPQQACSIKAVVNNNI